MSCFLSMSKMDGGQHPASASARAGAALAVFFLMTASSFANIIHLTTTLSGDQEVPPNYSKGTGTLTATYDTMTRSSHGRSAIPA